MEPELRIDTTLARNMTRLQRREGAEWDFSRQIATARSLKDSIAARTRRDSAFSVADSIREAQRAPALAALAFLDTSRFWLGEDEYERLRLYISAADSFYKLKDIERDTLKVARSLEELRTKREDVVDVFRRLFNN